jgi:integrase
MAKITAVTVYALMESGAPGVIRDGDLTGFAVRRNVDGTASYYVEFRAGRGRSFPVRRIVLGRHGKLTPDEARMLATEMLGRVVPAAVPLAERAAPRREMTVAALLRGAVENHWKAKRKPGTAKGFERAIERTLIPEFGAKRLTELRRADIRDWHASQTHRSRQANLDLAILRKALSIAVAGGLISENAAMLIPGHPERARDRIVTDDEMRAILEAVDSSPNRPQAALLFKLLMFTGCRLSEWRAAEWSWVDIARGELRLPQAAPAVRARTVPLSTLAQALLVSAPHRGRFVIPDDSGQAPLAPWSAHDAWLKVCKTAGVENLRLNDLRHAYATRGAGLGASAVLLRDVLGHKTVAMAARYLSRQVDPGRELAERVGAQIEAVRQPAATLEGVGRRR